MLIADFWTFDAECLRLTIDAFAGGAPVVDDVVERAGAIEQGSHQPAFLPIGIFDAASAKGLLGMLTRFSCRFRKQEWTAKRLSAKAIGMLKWEGRMHAQAFRAARRPIGIARDFFVTMVVEGDGRDARPVGDCFIDVPVVVSGISRHIGRELIGGHHSSLEEGAIIGDVGLIERQGVLG